jgi:hypothetical protein
VSQGPLCAAAPTRSCSGELSISETPHVWNLTLQEMFSLGACACIGDCFAKSH